MSTIITRNSANSGSVPSSLVQGELAINVTDGRLFYGSGSGNVVKEFTGSASGTTINTGSFVTTSSFNAYTGSNTSQFAGTASYALNALTASYAISASYEINYETSSSYADFAVSASHAISSSYAITASYSFNALSASYALTASFITASNVYGPYGSNSIISASYANYAETASSALNAQDILIRVLNQSGNPIAKGIVVHITASGNSSDIPRVITASYENDNNSANTLGIANETIANGAEGFIMTEGVLKGINTSAFISGQLIYLGATGSIIGHAPAAPLHAVRLGQVIRAQSNNGSIYVRIDNGYELDELHNVLINTSSVSYGDLLMYSSSLWVNSKQLSGSYDLTGSLNATSFTGSLLGTASYALSIPTPFRIATGSVSASVDIGTNIFRITSGSSTFFNIDNQGSTTVSNTAADIFLVKDRNNTPILTVSQSGIVIFATQSQEPAGIAVPGAFYFTSSSLFIGVE